MTTFGPILANKFKRPELRAKKPHFAMKRPHVQFHEGVYKTEGPKTAYRSGKVLHKFVAPEQHLYRPEAKAALAGPKGLFKVRQPIEHNILGQPHTQYKQIRKTKYVTPMKKEVLHSHPHW